MIKPARGHCHIAHVKGPEQTTGGIYIPEMSRKGSDVEPLAVNHGKVVSIGHPRRQRTRNGNYIEVPTEFSVGDEVIFCWQHGEIPDDYKIGESHEYLVKIDDVIGIGTPDMAYI